MHLDWSEPTQRTSLLILAGGRASRLGGVRKALLQVGKKPILERIIDQLGPLASERLALVHDSDLPPVEGLELAVDAREYAGPMPALANGLPAASGDVCLLVAGDMPFVSRAVFSEMLRIQATEHAAVVVPFVDGHMESMHAVFERTTLLAAIEAAQQHGEERLFKVFESLQARLVSEHELRAIDPELHT